MTHDVRLAASRVESGAEGVMAYVIKRYSNRKLYDTQESRYVTLD